MRSLDIALLTYSTKPRGGVVHTLNLAENLARLNHKVHVYTLSAGKNFFRQVSVPYTLIPCPETEYESIDEKIRSYIGIYTDYLSSHKSTHDIFHAEDCISANALLNLRERGLIGFFARTVHHIDDFTSESLVECQSKSILKPDHIITVSKTWERELSSVYSLTSTVINNGVDTGKFGSPPDEESKEAIKAGFSVGGSEVMLSIGGIEPRKNTLTALKAYNIARSYFKTKGERLVWMIGGGETLFDYRAYRDEFFSEIKRLGLKLDKDIFILGRIPEDSITNLYKAADVFVFPSVKEGWGLVVLEAMASGVPVIASGIEPMTEYLRDGDNSILVSPADFKSLAYRLIEVLGDGELRQRLVRGGRKTAEMFSWENTALEHARFYSGILGELNY